MRSKKKSPLKRELADKVGVTNALRPEYMNEPTVDVINLNAQTLARYISEIRTMLQNELRKVTNNAKMGKWKIRHDNKIENVKKKIICS